MLLKWFLICRVHQIEKNIINNYTATLENGALLNIVLYELEEDTTSIDFAGITTVYPANTIKLSVNIQGWRFTNLKNSLEIIIDAQAGQGQGCVNSQSTSSSLLWFMIYVGKISLYGQFASNAILDGRVRNITFGLNEDNTISAILPHFWDYSEMDPQFSVLLGDTNRGTCENDQKGVNKKVIAIVVPIVVVVVLLVILIVIYFAKFHSKWKILRHKSADSEMDKTTKIERAGDFNVQTASGTYNMRM